MDERTKTIQRRSVDFEVAEHVPVPDEFGEFDDAVDVGIGLKSDNAQIGQSSRCLVQCQEAVTVAAVGV
ncbi:hypothetical protein [Streptomyces sp. NPDC094032]|uniref:hypothetical protein n=1 Tax=Streptomyces sp. NPDC094032 TaxID=3155308 RepID=UPI0033280C09